MGGGKKPTLSAAEKRQLRMMQKEALRKIREKAEEKKVRLDYIPKEIEQQILEDVKKSKFITPQMIALKYDVKVSAALKFLKELVDKKVLETVIWSSRLKVFKAAA